LSHLKLNRTKKMKKNKSKYAVIYVRQKAAEAPDVSKEIAERERACRQYAKQQGFQVLGIFRDVYDDEIELGRTGLEFMLDFISDEGPHAVIVHEEDSLPENFREYGYASDVLHTLGVKLLCVSAEGA